MSSRSPEGKYEEYLERLRKRRDWLSERIEKNRMEGRTNALSYDIAEFSALDFTIDYLHNNPAAAIDYMEKWLAKKER